MSKMFITATYLVGTSNPEAALQAICRGQSVGNPNILTPYETKAFLNRWAAKGRYEPVPSVAQEYVMRVQFPQGNFGNEGVSYALSVLLGGQCDIDLIKRCRLLHVDWGNHLRTFPRPRYGIAGLRDRLGVPTRPLLCGIIKPKIGLSVSQLSEVVDQMLDGGCDVIKEDEILSNQSWCRLDDRLAKIASISKGRQFLYLACVTSDGSNAWKRARHVAAYGSSFGVHCNVWSGLGTLKDIRLHVACPLMFQKSGDKVLTQGPFAIEPSVLCELVHHCGADIAHVGMYGGYLAETVAELESRILSLQTTLPSFSCGMNPELAGKIIQRFGANVLITSGGWIHGQGSITHAVKTMRQSLETATQKVTGQTTQ